VCASLCIKGPMSEGTEGGVSFSNILCNCDQFDFKAGQIPSRTKGLTDWSQLYNVRFFARRRLH